MYAILIVILILIIYAYKKYVSENAIACRGGKCTDGCTRECYDRSSYMLDGIKSSLMNSAGRMDYTHSYWNGVRRLSCDECPNSYVCPECPKHAGSLESAAYNNEYFISDDMQAANGRDTPNTYDGTIALPSHTTDLPAHDMDAEFIGSREQMGASTSGKRNASILTSMTGESLGEDAVDAKFDSKGVAGISLGRGACHPCDSSAVKLLYTDIMGLTNPVPDTNQCEYLGYNGYLYKEPCDLSEPYEQY